MTKTFCHQCISLDGFTAAPNQSLENPFGEGGMRLPEWMFADQGGRPSGDKPSADQAAVDEIVGDAGAFIMGRNMFSPGRGARDETWRGWWGDDPPYHGPVFVLTHHPREPLAMEGGTTFTFVTDGPEAAYALAKDACGGRDISIAGGAATVRQYLRLGLIDELNLHVVPITIGAGERLFEDVGDLRFEPVEVTGSPAVTHVRYRRVP